jgi:hypothetical protein
MQREALIQIKTRNVAPKRMSMGLPMEWPMKLISGGQSGVDRAVLDMALARGIAYGGWCPRGGWAEDFPVPPGLLAEYPGLQETPLADPAQRTEWNMRDADACLIIAGAGGIAVSPGTSLAHDLARRYAKPRFVADLREADFHKRATLWLRAQRDAFGDTFALAIGGPRESEAPGIYARAVSFIGALIEPTTAASDDRAEPPDRSE